MPDFNVRAGDTNVTIYVRLRDSTTGLAKTGLVYNSAGAVASYVLPAAARAAITLATQTVTGAHSDGGFVEVDATNCKGLYRLDLPDAAVASGAYTLVSIEFDGIIEETIEIPLANSVNVTKWLGTAAATPTTAGVPEVDVTYIAGSLVSTATAQLGVNVVQLSADATAADNAEAFFDGTGYAGTGNVIPTVTTLTGHTAQTGDSFARLGAPAGASVSADVAAAKVDTAAILADTGTDGVVVAAASKTGYALSAAGVQAIWDALTSALTTVGSIGKLIVDNLNATISSRSSHSAADVWAAVTRTLTANTNLNDPTAATIADAVWDELATGHTSAGKAGEQLWTDLDAVLVDTADMQPKLGTPAGASVSADIAAVKVDTAATLADTGTDGVVVATGSKTGYTLAAVTHTGAVIPTVTTLTGHTAQTGDSFARLGAPAGASVSADIAAMKVDTAAILVDTAALDAAMADSIPADGTIPSPIQALYMLVQHLNERAVSGTTVTVKKVNGTTTLYTLTLNDGTTPTGITRAT